MQSDICVDSRIKLSICITTFNRASFIGATLDSIVGQATQDCEIVVLDAASTDDTQAVVSKYIDQFHRFRYIRQDTNNGFDQDCDQVVEHASGEYCWIMTDDDLLKPQAVATILQALRRDVSLVVINAESWDLTLSNLLFPRLLDFEEDRLYASGDLDQLFVDVGGPLNCNSVLMKRQTWLERPRTQYYGSWLIHFGVAFQERLPRGALLIAEPLIKYRGGNNHTYSPLVSEMSFHTWPLLIESLPISEVAKRKIHSSAPWRHLQMLLLCRALGYYTRAEYHKWIRPKIRSFRRMLIPAVVVSLPIRLVNRALSIYWSVTRNSYQSKPAEVFLQGLKEYRLPVRSWRLFNRG